ncbi:hypothetical protein BKA56DRAFT_609095 [Ilyonectria sp. MPI-CAGE-AT-0026]|nr:hypothetical protein BKA56DRAFT_609095 [Ilyonectria sp. MPI-CAGE-AT-0026]
MTASSVMGLFGLCKDFAAWSQGVPVSCGASLGFSPPRRKSPSLSKALPMPVPTSGLPASSRGVAHWLFSRRAWLDNGISCILEPERASIQGHVTSEQPLWCGEGHRIPCPSPRSSVALCKSSAVAEMREHCPNPITQHLHSQGEAHDWTLGAVVEAANFSPSLADSAASRSSVPRSSQPVSDRVGPKPLLPKGSDGGSGIPTFPVIGSAVISVRSPVWVQSSAVNARCKSLDRELVALDRSLSQLVYDYSN